MAELSSNKSGVCCPSGITNVLTAFPNACLKSSKSAVSIQPFKLQSRLPYDPLGQGIEVGVGVLVGIGVGVLVGVGVFVGNGVGVLVGIGVGVRVAVGVGVLVGIGVGVFVGIAVGVGVAVGLTIK